MKLKHIPLIPVAPPFERGRLYDPARDGVTAGLLSTFKACRERTRLFLNGWTSRKEKLATIFGDVCHFTLEHVYDAIRTGVVTEPDPAFIQKWVMKGGTVWKTNNPRASVEALRELELTLAMALVIMPAYFKHHRMDIKRMKWVQLEQQFKIPFEIKRPDGRVLNTFMRGKMDGVFYDRMSAVKGRPRLLETKTKAQISTDNLVDTLPHDHQTRVYLTALHRLHKIEPSGLLYNLVRRPGLHFKKADTIRSYAQRVATEVAKKPSHYFIRLRVDVDANDLRDAERELTALVGDFLLWWAGEQGHYKNSDACDARYGRCGFLGSFCGGDGAKSGRSGFYLRQQVFKELEA